VVARVPRQSAKNKDITGGLPRIAELFEARQPKEVAELAQIDGIVEVDKVIRNKRQIVIVDPTSQRRDEHNNIPLNKHLMVSRGDRVRKGQKLTVGSIVPQKLLEVSGVSDLQRHLVNEIQLVYRTQGVEINDKHVEIIIRQMMQKVKITDPGNTEFLPGEQLDRGEFERINRQLIDSGKQPAVAEPVLLGITKAALETESFISAASFQDTTRILTEAATVGKVDALNGFKENVITGHLIPAGTGTERLQSIELRYLGEEIEQETTVQFEERESASVEEATAKWRSAAPAEDEDFGDDDDDWYPEQEQSFDGTIEDDFGEGNFDEEETFDNEDL
jgi:DNA-directed RNA polymerase subunit beta'